MADEKAEMRPLPNKKHFHVLILHSTNDYDLAKQMCEEFKQNQFICKIRHSSDALKETKHELYKFWNALCAIKRACVVVLLFSKSFIESKRCKLERRLSLHIGAKYGREYINLIPLSINKTRIPNKYESLVQGFDITPKDLCSWWPKVLKAVTEDVNLQCKYQSYSITPDSDDGKSGPFDFESSDDTDDESWSSCCSDEEGNTVLDIVLFHLLEEVINEDGVDCESDKEFKDIMKVADLLLQLLDTASFPNRLKFLNVTSRSGGLSSYLGQMGLRNFHRMLLNGCGMEIYQNTLSLKWETFEQNLARSNITLADIVCYGERYGIHNFRLEFNQEALEKFERQYGKNWQTLFQAFGEKVLKDRFRDRENDSLTYRVKITGNASALVKHKANRSAKSFYQRAFTAHSEIYTTQEARLATFRNWPGRFSRTFPTCLAAAGFIYAGTGDTVTCFSCNQSFYGLCGFMEKLVDMGNVLVILELMVEHAYWNSQCTFLRQHWTPQMSACLSARKALRESDIVKHMFTEFETRLKSFSPCLPELLRIELADAGFYCKFASFGEKFVLVECATCGVSINIDVERNIWMEHIKWSPDCEYVHRNKTENYIRAVKQKLERDKQNETKVELVIETLLLRNGTRQENEFENSSRTRTQTQYIEQDIELD